MNIKGYVWLWQTLVGEWGMLHHAHKWERPMMSLEREQNFYKAMEVLITSFITNADSLPIKQSQFLPISLYASSSSYLVNQRWISFQ